MESPPYDIIEYLVAHGAYVEAARIATDRGELRRAIALYERVWRFVDALPLARHAGRSRAGRAAGAGRQPAGARDRDRGRRPRARPTCWRSPTRSPSAGASSRRAAPPSARGGGRAPPRCTGARTRRSTRRGRACAPASCARRACFTNGWWRRGAPTRPPPRGWRWGGCSAGWAATRRPPATCRPPRARPALRTAARRALCAPLLALGFRGAAGEVVERLRKDQPALPRNPEEFVALEEAEAAAAEGDGVPARAAQRRRRDRGRAPLRDPPAAGRRRHRPRLRGASTRCWARRSRSSCCSSAARPAIPSARRTCASRARPRRPGGCATRTSSRCYDAQPASGLFVFELMPGGTLAERLADQRAR